MIGTLSVPKKRRKLTSEAPASITASRVFLTARRLLPVHPDEQTFSVSVDRTMHYREYPSHSTTDAVGLANAFDKFKPLTPEHHIWRVPSKPREVSRVCIAPILQRTVTFALVISKRLIDVIETSLRQFNCLEDSSRDALPV